MKLLNLEFTRIAHDTFKIKGSRTIYTDPFKVTGRDEADIVLLSHEHFDHLSLEDLDKVIFPGTTIVASPLCKDGLKAVKVKQIRFLDPGGKISVGKIEIEAVPAYNVNKFREPGSCLSSQGGKAFRFCDYHGWHARVFRRRHGLHPRDARHRRRHRVVAGFGNLCDDAGRSRGGSARHPSPDRCAHALCSNCRKRGRRYQVQEPREALPSRNNLAIGSSSHRRAVHGELTVVLCQRNVEIESLRPRTTDNGLFSNDPMAR